MFFKINVSPYILNSADIREDVAERSLAIKTAYTGVEHLYGTMCDRVFFSSLAPRSVGTKGVNMG